ncbi:MAG: citramalate synthase, partial [Oscillospiraceae bacterium]|nr:citramalate synthase [Oscillospiraceae bacterium]
MEYEKTARNLKAEILDSTLRDGAQGKGISYSVGDKLNILKILDEFGVDFIEAGNPFSNPKDTEFFELAKAPEHRPKYAKLTAFGATKRKGIPPSADANLTALLSAETEYISIFGKSSELHAKEILGVELQENIDMIYDTVRYLTENGRKVLFDAEHFFDGYKLSPEYALKTLKTAQQAGAYRLILCDTNGGCFTDEIYSITKKAVTASDIPVGIHCHNDMDLAVANSFSALSAGAAHIQGTFIGTGERCGNTNLASVIPSLKLKLGYDCCRDISALTGTARHIAEISNISLRDSNAYVGVNAFSHKAGMHVDAIKKNSGSFEHISPYSVGNARDILVSEVSGRS